MRKCKVEGCDNKHEGLGYCRKHWRNLNAGRQLEPSICKNENCNKKDEYFEKINSLLIFSTVPKVKTVAIEPTIPRIVAPVPIALSGMAMYNFLKFSHLESGDMFSSI